MSWANVTKQKVLLLEQPLYLLPGSFFLSRRQNQNRIKNPKRNNSGMNRSNLVCFLFLSPAINSCLLQLLGLGYLKLDWAKEVEKVYLLRNICLCMLKNSKQAGVPRDREDKEVIKNRIFYWLQQFRARPCHSLALILGNIPHASSHWE